jgi:hypothetical protein
MATPNSAGTPSGSSVPSIMPPLGWMITSAPTSASQHAGEVEGRQTV